MADAVEAAPVEVEASGCARPDAGSRREDARTISWYALTMSCLFLCQVLYCSGALCRREIEFRRLEPRLAAFLQTLHLARPARRVRVVESTETPRKQSSERGSCRESSYGV